MNMIKREDLLKINCLGRPIADYKIVYNDGSDMGEYFVAMDLRYHLYYDVGADVPVVTDDEAESEYEILIGHTNRGGDKDVNGEYTIYAQGTKLYIVSDRLTGYVEADRYITSTLLDLASESALLSDGYCYKCKI